MADRVEMLTRAQWRAWLADNHASSPGAWVVYYKQSSGKAQVTYEELVEEGLCFGWIDSRPAKVDDERTSLYFCPRKRGSGWAATNKVRIERLEAQGLIAPAGRTVIDQAKADGSWTLLDASEAAIVPEDLTAAFERYPRSREQFEAFPRGVRKNIIGWIDLAKTAQTRARRVDEAARLAQQGIRANQGRPKEKPSP
jgi:uncharacterized protein YdeI (YjbR/CyaY-like superfamily)